MTIRGQVSDATSRTIVRAVNDSGKVQTMKIEDDAEGDDGQKDLVEVEAFRAWGVSGVPPAGAEAITVNVGADGAQQTVVATQHCDYRPRNLAEGEVCLYTKDGVRVYCKADGITYIGDEPEDFVANATKVDAEFQRIWDMFSAWVTVPNDGGAALKTLADSAGPGVQSVACTQLKAK